MKKIILSGINIFEGGPLSVFKDCLEAMISNDIHKDNEIIIFVHDSLLFEEFKNYVHIIELPLSRKGYLFRLWYEYVYFFFFSVGKEIDYWLSLHDITPNVISKHKIVYCHNPMPFYKNEEKKNEFPFRMKLFNIFYKYIYKINLKKNDYVIVQQHWIKDRFVSFFNVNNVIVAHPNVPSYKPFKIDNKDIADKEKIKRFIYPAFPRFFKNFEVICEATKILTERGYSDFEIILTIDGSENVYSRQIVDKYKYIKNINFVGLLDRDKLFQYYNNSDCLIFPSKIETWGLPITEYKKFNKPLILANLEYTKETLGSYDKVKFFSTNSASELSEIIAQVIEERINWSVNEFYLKAKYENWNELVKGLFIS